jgi:dipeptidyl aminopeptidase/acylaminoacyl peptidase
VLSRRRNRPGKPLELLTGHLPGSFFNPCSWSADGTGFFVWATGDGDRAYLGYFSVADRTLTAVDVPGWDVEDVAVSRDGRTVAWTVNQGGRSMLRARLDGAPVDTSPIPDGVVEAMDLSADGEVAVILLDTPALPLAAAVGTPGSAQPIRYLTDSRPAAIRVPSDGQNRHGT